MGFSFRRFLLATLSCREAGVTQSEWKRLRFSYAQEGEDIIAQALLPEAEGFYVEVGAFHPVSISNTYLFYRKGWRGIVIDPVPGVARRFQQRRPDDIFLEYAVSDEEGEKVFDIMSAGETNHLNGGQAPLSSSRVQAPLSSIPVRCRRLATILTTHLPAGQRIDFLTVDTEGHDLNVLRSNDWGRYRPRVVAVEDFLPVAESPICRFLMQENYTLVISSKMTRFFQPTESLAKP